MIIGLWIIAVVLPLVVGIPAVREETLEGAIEEAVDLGTDSEQGVDKKGKIWAVLVAGSYRYANYRHQADICHAYQIFRQHGIPDENIIVMMYDDIASDPENPTPGVIINKPGGPNVYENVPKDYTGAAVTTTNFLNVITGNDTGSGKVLKSGKNDHVFINMVDKGSRGIFGFPDGYLYATDFNEALKTMYEKKMYKKLVVYLECSYCGSMVESLPSNRNIMAVSACKSDEQSYATYWDSDREVYLGDLFSVAYMEDIDSEEGHKNLTTETLKKQFNNIVQRCSGKSTPTMYGTKSIAKDHVIDFFGKDKKETYQAVDESLSSRRFEEAVKSQDVFLHTLKNKIKKREDPEEKEKLQKELEALLQGRNKIDRLFERIISHLPNVQSSDIVRRNEPLTDELFPCYRTLVDAFHNGCVDITKNTFTLRHLYKFVNICASDISTHRVLEAFKLECTSPSDFDNIH